MRVAVLDLGSTSFRLMVAEADANGHITPHSKKRAILDLGMVVGREGMIPEPFATQAVKTVARLRKHAERLGAEAVIPVATSALRDATNRDELARRLGKAAGSPVRFLTGDEEARLTFAAVAARFDLGADTILALDLGGGSLELVVGDRTGPLLVESLPIGAARLMGTFARHDPMKRTERERLRLHVEQALETAVAEISPRRPGRFVASGGTVKAIARLLAADRGHPGRDIHGMTLETEELQDLRDRVMPLRRSKRARLPGVGIQRAGSLPAGALVLAAASSMLGAPGLSVSDWGLREGIILHTLRPDESLGATRIPLELAHLSVNA